MRWLYVAGLALLIWRHWKLGRPLVVFEIYLWCSLVANVIYSPGHPYVWLATQAVMLPARIGVLIEIWYYATYRMLPRERNSMLLMAACFGLVWTAASWDVSGDTLERIAGHIRNRVHIGLCAMLITGALYLWTRPISLHRNVPVHAAIFLVHVVAQATADALWVRYPLDKTQWFAVNHALLLINLGCLAGWGLLLSPWTARER